MAIAERQQAAHRSARGHVRVLAHVAGDASAQEPRVLQRWLMHLIVLLGLLGIVLGSLR
jgi:hypothetical protein